MPGFVRVPKKLYAGDFSDVVIPSVGVNGYAAVWNNTNQRAEWTALGTAAALNTGTGTSNVVQYTAANEITASARVITPVVRVPTDTITSFKIQNAAGTSDVFWIDSTNKTVNAMNSMKLFAAASLGTTVTFSSNGGSATGFFELDLTGNMVFRQAQGSMYYDYYNTIIFRRVASSYGTRATLSNTAFDVTGNVTASDRIAVGTTTPTAFVDVAASTTTYAALRLRSGTAPTAPNDGDIWFDGTNLKMRVSGTTKTFTLV